MQNGVKGGAKMGRGSSKLTGSSKSGINGGGTIIGKGINPTAGQTKFINQMANTYRQLGARDLTFAYNPKNPSELIFRYITERGAVATSIIDANGRSRKTSKNSKAVKEALRSGRSKIYYA